MFSYVSAEQRVPQDHPLRAIRALVDDVLRDMTREFDRLYAAVGRPSIPPERLLRAQLLQIFYSLRSERLLMEQLDCNLLFRWFAGLLNGHVAPRATQPVLERHWPGVPFLPVLTNADSAQRLALVGRRAFPIDVRCAFAARTGSDSANRSSTLAAQDRPVRAVATRARCHIAGTCARLALQCCFLRSPFLELVDRPLPREP
jgi:hypothetical protein